MRPLKLVLTSESLQWSSEDSSQFPFHEKTFSLICCALRMWHFLCVCQLVESCRPVVDPLQVVGHPGVDAIASWSGTALTPADYPQQEDGLLVLCHQGSAAVTFTRVLPTLDVSGTEHVLGERHTTVLLTLLCADAWDFQPPQKVWGGPVFTPPAPAAHRV